MTPHSSTLAWKTPWMEEPGRLQSMGSLRVRHDWATSLSLFISCIGEGNGNPLQCSCLENRRDGGAWRAAIYGVAQSRTRLKRLSSSSLWEKRGDHLCLFHRFVEIWIFNFFEDTKSDVHISVEVSVADFSNRPWQSRLAGIENSSLSGALLPLCSSSDCRR